MMKFNHEGYRLLHDGTLALSQIESNGIRIDTAYLDDACLKVDAKVKELTEELKKDPIAVEWEKIYRKKTNFGSRDQLATVIFDRLGYQSNSFTPTGQPKTDSEALEALDLPFTKAYLRVEKLKKTRSTFLEGIRRETVDGFLHPMFDLNTARTFRSSSSWINFQNLPIRDVELSGIVRRCFIPRKGRCLVEIDYSGIEVKVAYFYHLDTTMKTYLTDPTKDMHRDMAAQLYKLPVDQVTKNTRYCAKNQFVFPQFYGDYYLNNANALWNSIDHMHLTTVDGMGMEQWLKSKGITSKGLCNPKEKPKPGTFEHHVKTVETDFWQKRFPVYAKWKKSWYKQYERRGWFETLTGFTIQGCYSRNDVTNYPIQGSAFHCLLKSLIEILRRINKRKLSHLIGGQIHDSTLGDVKEREVPDYIEMVKRVSTDWLQGQWDWISVPLDVEAEVAPVGESWFSKRAWKE